MISKNICKTERGASEVLSYMLVIFIIIAVVGVIFAGVMPAIEKSNSLRNFEESKLLIKTIDQKINELLLAPIGSTSSITVNLSKVNLEIDSTNQTIEAYHLISGNYYKEGVYITEGNTYTERDFEKLIVGLTLSGVSFTGDIDLTNISTNLHITKTAKNQISFAREIDSTDVSLSDTTVRDRPDLNIPDAVMEVNITSPTDSASFIYTQSIDFNSTIIDPTGSYSCAWDSNIDGNLSTACNFSSSNLSTGSHTITLSVTDENQTLEDTVDINVIPSMSVTIDSPLDLSSTAYGSNIDFNSTVTNPVGTYSCSWDSNIDGNLSASCNFSSSSLSLGSHIITLSVTDENQTLEDTVDIIISIPLLSLDVATINDELIFYSGDTVNFSAIVDNNVGNYTCSWRSSIDNNISEDGLLLKYNFDNNDSNIAIDSKNNFDGNISGAVSSLDTTTGAGKSLSFNTNNYITSVPSNSLSLGNDVTLSTWFKCSYTHGTVLSSTAARLINLHGSSPGTTFALIIGSDGLGLYNSGRAAFSNVAPDPCTGEWTLGAATLDSSGNVKLYKNNNNILSVTGGSNTYSSYALTIGTYEYLSRFYNGLLDDVRVYNKALSLEEVSNLYNSPNNCDINISTLSTGSHTITLSVTDENQTLEDTVDINIINLMSVTIDSPLDLSSTAYGSNIDFNSTITDPVGSYTCSWDSNIDGNLSADCNFSSSSLSSGNHIITLSVTDENQIIDQNISISILSLDGSSSERAAPSAMYIKTINPSATNGVYWILKNGTPTQIYCNMVDDGGGWMLYSSFSTDNTYSSSYPAWNGNRILYPNFSTYGFILDYATHYSDGVNGSLAFVRRPEFFSFFYNSAPHGLFTMSSWNGPSDVNQLRVYFGIGTTYESYSGASGNIIINNATVVTGTGGDYTSINVLSFNPVGTTPLFRIEEIGVAGISWIFMR